MPDTVPSLPPHVAAVVEEYIQQLREDLPPRYRALPEEERERKLRERAAAMTRDLSTYTWSVEAIQAALAQRDPELAKRVIIAGTRYNRVYSE